MPAATLWASDSMAEVAKKFFDEREPMQRPIDSMIDKSTAAALPRLR